MSAEHLSSLNKLFLISGTPRSGTTFLHDQIVAQNFLPGSVRDRKAEWQRDPQTSEYRPSMEGAVHYPFATGASAKKDHLGTVAHALQELAGRFLADDGRMMLKAPHYSYCGEAYKALLGNRFNILFLKRNYVNCALSMSKHWRISPQLEAKPDLSGDFQKGRSIFRKGVDTQWAHPIVAKFATEHWNALSKIERAFYKIHYFRRASNASREHLSGQYFDLDYEEMGSPAGLQIIAQFLEVPETVAQSLLADFDPVKPTVFEKDLSQTGRDFLELCQEYETTF